MRLQVGVAVAILALIQMALASQFAVVFDAGSTHTTGVVYKWDKMINGTGVIKEVADCEVSPDRGVDDVDPERVKDFLFENSCTNRLEKTAIAAPGSTPTKWFLGATGGMRNLKLANAQRYDQIMGKLRSDPRLKNGTMLLEADDEGTYGWLTVNYILQGTKINVGNQIGALDWGGASAQITYAFPEHSNNRISPTTMKSKTMSVFGKHFDVFTKSHMCYGQAEVINRYLLKLVLKEFRKQEQQDLSQRHGEFFRKTTIEAPCQPALTRGQNNFEVDLTEALHNSKCVSDLVDSNFKAILANIGNVTFTGTGDKAKCEAELKELFDEAKCKSVFKTNCFDKADDPSFRPRKFYAFSTFWYLADYLRLDIRVKSHLLKQEHHRVLQQKVDGLCGRRLPRPPKDETDQNECFRSVLMTTLLRDGYGFGEETKIAVVDKVKGQAVGWSLGFILNKSKEFAIAEAKTDLDQDQEQGYSPYTIFYKIGAFLANNW